MGLHEVDAAQEYGSRRRIPAVQPCLHALNGNAEILRELVLAAQHDAGSVQRLYIDVGVLGRRRANILHARIVPGKPLHPTLGEVLISCSRANYILLCADTASDAHARRHIRCCTASVQQHRIYAELLQEAAQILGSEQRLAYLLGVPRAELREWLNGSAMPPLESFLRTLDIV